MDLTQGTFEEKNNRAKKMMLWFGLISLFMSFAGWTSAFIVSSKRPDWLTDFEMPQAFQMSVALIIASSVTLFFAKKMLLKGKNKLTTILLSITFALGILFVVNQFAGFREILNQGYNFTGPTSNVTMSYIYLIAIVHIAHVLIGLFCLPVVIYNNSKQKYSEGHTLGLDLASTFWHFVDLLWVYLFLFFTFMN